MKSKILISLLIGIMVIASGCGAKQDEKVNNEVEQQENQGEQQEKVDAVSSASKEEKSSLEFEKVPERVAVGTVGLTEIFDALEIELVGVPSSSSYEVPERYKDAQRIGMSMKPDAEILKKIEADVLITDASLKQSLEESLQGKGINTSFVATSGYDDIMNSIVEIGKAFGKEDKAKEIVKQMKNKEENVASKIENKDKKKVMVIFGTPESFMLATDMSYVGDLVKRLNLSNITDGMENIKSPYVPFSIESVVSINPDIILRFTHADPETSKKMFEKEFSENKVWQAMEAVKSSNVYDLDPHYFGVVANLRCADALEKLYEMIYGE